MDLKFVLPRPKSKVWKTKEMPSYPHTIKPDIDNLIKSFKDALNGVVWKDDSQVWMGSYTKCVAAGNESPHVVATIQLED